MKKCSYEGRNARRYEGTKEGRKEERQVGGKECM